MDHPEEFEETVDQNRPGTASGPMTGTERIADNRPPVLKPEVVTRGGVENPFDGLAKGLPDVLQRAKGFYSRHPTLVKAIATVVVAGIARRLFRGRPGLF